MKPSKMLRFFRLGMENYLIFQPAKFRSVKIQRNLLKKFKTVRFVTPDGARLFAWFIPPKDGKITILYFHGQAESILSHQDVAEFAINNGYGCFMLSYRGHYRSWGIPSEQGIFIDADTAIKQLNKLGIETKDLVIWGHSLGTTVATNTALNYDVKALILQSPVLNITSAATDCINFYFRRLRIRPLRRYVRKHFQDIIFIQKFDNFAKIPNIKCKILLAHSKTDRMTPSKNSRILKVVKPEAELFLADRGSHWSMNWCIDKISEFIENL